MSKEYYYCAGTFDYACSNDLHELSLELEDSEGNQLVTVGTGDSMESAASNAVDNLIKDVLEELEEEKEEEQLSYETLLETNKQLGEEILFLRDRLDQLEGVPKETVQPKKKEVDIDKLIDSLLEFYLYK